MPVVGSYDDFEDDSISRSRSSCSCSPFSDGGVIPRMSFSYHKLPPTLIKLSVVKLDGNSFDVQIAGNASVGEMKVAVEDVFIQASMVGDGEISWSHVWGHFCLCYEGQKLTNDKDIIRNLGIKDGDKLHFIRHLSINYNSMRRRSKRENGLFKDQSSSHGSSSVSEKELESNDSFVSDDRVDEEDTSQKDEQVEDNIDFWQDEDLEYYKTDREKEFIGHQEFKVGHLIKGWLSYSTLWFVGRTKTVGKTKPTRFSGHFFRLGSKMRLTSF
ncbi:hypothetical protein ACHQM5_029027 [Ranunculus cassubicifolius]